ncbi:MAG: hypothetical protein QW579_04645 [Desulfurococcaceae archaeon]
MNTPRTMPTSLSVASRLGNKLFHRIPCFGVSAGTELRAEHVD